MIPFREDALRQWQELKNANPTATVGILFEGRYEFYNLDANLLASGVSGVDYELVNMAIPAAVPMAAFPAASSAAYVAALEALGHTVILAED